MTSAWPDLTNVIGIPSPSDFDVRIANRPSVFDEDHQLDFDMTIGQNGITIGLWHDHRNLESYIYMYTVQTRPKITLEQTRTKPRVFFQGSAF